MPSRLKRYQKDGAYHFLTFSCYRRLALFRSPTAREVFESELEKVRQMYEMFIFGYVVMPEHVHLLVSEPRNSELSHALQALKQMVSRKLPHPNGGDSFWQKRYYDFNVVSHEKWTEKLKYIHRNPVKRGLVGDPSEWKWSSYRHYLMGEVGTVEIESSWTFMKRVRSGVPLRFLKIPE